MHKGDHNVKVLGEVLRKFVDLIFGATLIFECQLLIESIESIEHVFESLVGRRNYC